MVEWSATLTGERHLAPSTIRSYQGEVRQFTEFLRVWYVIFCPACDHSMR